MMQRRCSAVPRTVGMADDAADSDDLAWELRRRLGWLARALRANREPLLLLERLQPSWLERRWERWLYLALSRVGAAVGFGAVIGLSEMLEYSRAAIRVGAPGKPALGLIVGVAAGLLIALVDAAAMGQEEHRSRHGRWRFSRVLAFLATALIWAAAAAAVIAPAPLEVLWGEAVAWALLGALLFGAQSGRAPSADIHLPEELHWSLAGLGRGVARGAVLGMGLALLTAWIARPSLAWLGAEALALASAGAVFGAAIGAPFGAARGRPLAHRVVPNQGVHVTLEGSAIVFVLAFVGFGLVAGSLGVFLDLQSGVLLGATLGLSAALTAALWFGGMAAIRHYALRAVLVLGGHTPVRLVRFLDWACELVFLRPIGGGYVFVHDFFRDHFADSRPTPTQSQGRAR
jgi:hypothetical protein